MACASTTPAPTTTRWRATTSAPTPPAPPRLPTTHTAAGNAFQTITTITLGGLITGGSFTVTVAGVTTGAIAWSASASTVAANIQAALDALSTVGPGNSVVSMIAGVASKTTSFLVTY